MRAARQPGNLVSGGGAVRAGDGRPRAKRRGGGAAAQFVAADVTRQIVGAGPLQNRPSIAILPSGQARRRRRRGVRDKRVENHFDSLRLQGGDVRRDGFGAQRIGGEREKRLRVGRPAAFKREAVVAGVATARNHGLRQRRDIRDRVFREVEDPDVREGGEGGHVGDGVVPQMQGGQRRESGKRGDVRDVVVEEVEPPQRP